MPNLPPARRHEHYQELLQQVEARLEEASRQRVGSKRRGTEPMRRLLRAEAPSGVKRSNVNLRTARTELFSLVYQRHALRHGGFRLTDLTKQQLAVSFLGEEACNMELTAYEARIILKQQWRMGRSPLLEDYQKKLKTYLDRAQSIKTKYCRRQALLVMREWRRNKRQRQYQQRLKDQECSTGNTNRVASEEEEEKEEDRVA